MVPQYGLVLCSRFPPGDDAGARFAEQVEQVHHAIVGGPRTCRDRLAELIETVGPVLRPQWPGLPHERVPASLRRLTDDVLPALAGVAA